MTNSLVRLLGILFGLTLALLVFVEMRLAGQGKWIPKELPIEVGGWYAADMPLSRYSLKQLGDPPAIGRRYSNLFNERVDAHVIPTTSYDAYLEPIIVWAGYGYQLTAERIVAPFGKAGQVRQMLLQNVTDGSRMMLYYWIQNQDGTVSARGSVRKERDFLLRLGLGANAIFSGDQKCIVRVYTQLHRMDTKGLQARRNMDAISRAIYESLKKQGTSGDRAVVGQIDTTEKKVSGVDASYLTTPLYSEEKGISHTNLLPLTQGTTWNMTAKREGENETSSERVIVGNTVNIKGVSGTEINVYRNGKRWRREVVRKVKNEIQLVAIQDETSPLMVMSPPLPLFREPVKEGDTLQWIGDYKLVVGPRPDGTDSLLRKDDVWPARGYSRISGIEEAVTPAGKFKVYRIDTIVVANRFLNKQPQEVRFPTVRWVSPGVGYVRRGFADKGRPAFSELTRFDLK